VDSTPRSRRLEVPPNEKSGLNLFQQVRVFIFLGSANIGDSYFGFLAICKIFDMLLLYGMGY
jgi:hypothetical protein